MDNVQVVQLISPVVAEVALTKQEIRVVMAVSAEVAEAVIDKIHLLQVQRELQIPAVAAEVEDYLQVVELPVVVVSL
ncbi:MAG: hypothetical protein CML17_09840 [Pusillimonas sp.]|jgi:hypothetical protein|nr:hypothetical protein [Pusillimonas sp.]